MKIAGIIAEYNPFHNGHLYQINETKADIVVAVMSGNFVQRGLPACWDKWTRAKYAVENGVDLILELPVDFSVASAERFAFGGVYILNSLGCIDTLCFGAEDDLSVLKDAESALNNANIKELIKKAPQGTAYHQLRNLAVPDSNIIKKPNNILAIEYLKALTKLSSPISPFAVKRVGAGYNETVPKDGYASATYLREALKTNAYKPFMPLPVPDEKTLNSDDFYELILYALQTKNLSEIAEVREGIENRILKAMPDCKDFDELVDKIKSKRYTRASVCRMLIQALLGIEKSKLSDHPLYTRVLASTKKGCEVLSSIRKTSTIPIVTKGADAPSCKEFELDTLAGNIYNIVSGKPLQSDFTKSPYIKEDV